MQRDILNRIFDWNKSGRRKPLVLMGARQVGKTWLMNAFAEAAYPGDTVYVNLMKMKALRNSLEASDLSPSALLERIRVALDADALETFLWCWTNGSAVKCDCCPPTALRSAAGRRRAASRRRGTPA